MSETGFYHPDRGYWQAIAGDPAALLASYPQGTTVVPLRPNCHCDWDGLQWVEAPPTPAELKAHLATLRYDHEVGGVTVSGMDIASDLGSQAKILAVRVAAIVDTNFTTSWKALNGFFTLDATAIVAISDAVRDHIAGAFAAEAAVSAQIDAATVTDKAGVEAAFAAALAAWAAPG